MPMLSDRQQQLLEILQTRHRLSTDEVMSHFSISPATASRDIHALILAGLAAKASRGLRLATPEDHPVGKIKCAYCSGTVSERTLFIVQMQDGSQRSACCCHCGLMALTQANAQTALASDFLYGRMINARQATYVMNSRVSLCCEPSVLCFANAEEARCFQAGFGGTTYTLEAALFHLRDLMRI